MNRRFSTFIHTLVFGLVCCNQQNSSVPDQRRQGLTELIVREFEANDSKLLSQPYRCVFLDFVQNHFDPTLKSHTSNVGGVSIKNFADFENFDFAIISSGNDVVDYYGLSDIYQFEYSTNQDSIISIDNLRLSNLMRRYVSSRNSGGVGGVREALAEFVFYLYMHGSDNFSTPMFSGGPIPKSVFLDLLEYEKRPVSQLVLDCIMTIKDEEILIFELIQSGHVIFDLSLVNNNGPVREIFIPFENRPIHLRSDSGPDEHAMGCLGHAPNYRMP